MHGQNHIKYVILHQNSEKLDHRLILVLIRDNTQWFEP